jgi:hypothetical protein
MTASTAQRLLVLLLRLSGLMMLSAVIAVFMPLPWMDYFHRRMGLGPFPSAPVAEYLARLCSAVYGLIGVQLMVLASDVRRYAVMIAVTSVGVAVIAVIIGVLAFLAGMPWWWSVGDAATAVPFAAAVVALQCKLGACLKAQVQEEA